MLKTWWRRPTLAINRKLYLGLYATLITTKTGSPELISVAAGN